MDQKTFKNVLLETVAQAKASNPGTDQVRGRKTRCNPGGIVAQMLLAFIEDLGHEQWIEQRTF